MGLQRVGHDWASFTFTFTLTSESHTFEVKSKLHDTIKGLYDISKLQKFRWLNSLINLSGSKAYKTLRFCYQISELVWTLGCSVHTSSDIVKFKVQTSLVVVSCKVVSDSCDRMDYSLTGSFFCGISQARTLSGLPFPPPGDLSDPRIEPVFPVSPALAGGFFTTEPARILSNLIAC